jgi:hypothetical protein
VVQLGKSSGAVGKDPYQGIASAMPLKVTTQNWL